MNCPLGRVHGGVTAGGDKIEGGVLSKLGGHRLPVQAWFPLCLFQHLQDLFHHNVAPFFRQMQPIPATQKLLSSYSGRRQEQTANNSREACSDPVLPLLHGMPEINHLQVHLLAQSYAGVRVQTAGFVGPDNLTKYSTAAHIICSVPCVILYCNKPGFTTQLTSHLVEFRSISSFRGGQLRKMTRVFSERL